MGRASQILKRTSHLTITLSEKINKRGWFWVKKLIQ
jgi:hypothetical protein